MTSRCLERPTRLGGLREWPSSHWRSCPCPQCRHPTPPFGCPTTPSPWRGKSSASTIIRHDRECVQNRTTRPMISYNKQYFHNLWDRANCFPKYVQIPQCTEHWLPAMIKYWYFASCGLKTGWTQDFVNWKRSEFQTFTIHFYRFQVRSLPCLVSYLLNHSLWRY